MVWIVDSESSVANGWRVTKVEKVNEVKNEFSSDPRGLFLSKKRRLSAALTTASTSTACTVLQGRDERDVLYCFGEA